MSIGGKQPELDPADDTLINVNAFGDPVMSARFMGGREYEIVVGEFTVEPSASEIEEVLKEAIMLLPAVVPDAGPFVGMQSIWKSLEPNLGSGQRVAAVGFYLSLVTARCLELIGHEGPIIIEGPFSRNRCFIMMLSVAAGVERQWTVRQVRALAQHCWRPLMQKQSGVLMSRLTLFRQNSSIFLTDMQDNGVMKCSNDLIISYNLDNFFVMKRISFN